MWKTETIHIIEYHEFDKLVEDHLGINYEIIADEELHNDMTWNLGSVPSKYWDEYDEKDLAEVLAGERKMYSSRLLVQALWLRGIIPPGEWQVNVSW